MKQTKKYVHSTGTWLIIVLAGLLFFMSMSSLAWGITSLAHQDLAGIWFLGSGALLQGAAISSVWTVEKKELSRLIHS